MAQKLVRVRLDNTETNVGAAYAKAHDLTVLDEPTSNPDGTRRGATRKGGRPRKQRTSVSQETAKNKAAVDSAPSEKESDR